MGRPRWVHFMFHTGVGWRGIIGGNIWQVHQWDEQHSSALCYHILKSDIQEAQAESVEQSCPVGTTRLANEVQELA